MLPNDAMNPLFAAAVQSVEEAVINAMIAAETMVGRDDHRLIGLPHDAVQQILRKYSRLEMK
jgi:L-aminopeptidase/D-esterase-like protein